jgi:hypothetical protein
MDYEKQWEMLKETIECMVETLVETVGTAVECNGGRVIIHQSENPALNALCILSPLMTEMEKQKPESFEDMIKCYDAVTKSNVIEVNKPPVYHG